MATPFSYEGKRVVVSGGGGAGMGAAAVEGLAELGAEIHVLDLKDPPVKVASHQIVDLRDPDAVTAAVEKIGGTIDALFNAAGLPGAPFPDLDTMLVNFAAPRHLTSCVVPHMTNGGAICSISSTAGSGYLLNLEKWMPLVDTPDFASAKAWCEEHPDDILGAYSQSKEALIIWTMKAAMDLNAQGIRLNCISPGPTDTPMMPAFEDMAGGGADHRPLRPGARSSLHSCRAGLADDLPQQRRGVVHLRGEPQHRRRHRVGHHHRPPRARVRPLGLRVVTAPARGCVT